MHGAQVEGALQRDRVRDGQRPPLALDFRDAPAEADGGVHPRQPLDGVGQSRTEAAAARAEGRGR
ncbi:hypothetical protein ABVB69_11720 [Streptomyces sp. NPDC000349]|uniref:hypothetical protein n=1 Tax=unclassified Streptomyces TaxID=2593676 RepID=UPI0027D7C6A3|nr:hypothetical protein [Streptomyces sp. DSM 40167]